MGPSFFPILIAGKLSRSVVCYNSYMETWVNTVAETFDERVARLLRIGLVSVADGDEVGRMRELKTARLQARLLCRLLPPHPQEPEAG